MLAFFKISCPVCQLTFPFLERIQPPGHRGFIGISQNDAADTREFNQEFGVTFPILLDSEDENFPAATSTEFPASPPCSWWNPDGTIAHLIEGLAEEGNGGAWLRGRAPVCSDRANMCPNGRPVEDRATRRPAGSHARIRITAWPIPSKKYWVPRARSPKG